MFKDLYERFMFDLVPNIYFYFKFPNYLTYASVMQVKIFHRIIP